MTKREFLNAVIAETTNSDLASFAVSELEKLDARNAKRASAPSKKSLENAPLIAKIAESLTSEPKLASEVASELEISTQKASALLRQIENVSVCDVKVKGKGTQKGYFFAEQSKQGIVGALTKSHPTYKIHCFTSYPFLDSLTRLWAFPLRIKRTYVRGRSMARAPSSLIN